MGEKVTCGKTTQELLLEFQQTGDQAPFEEIARRYAGMVYNVALQVTHDAHDAEDATQATFLTLAVHAKTAGKIRYVGPWLRKVSQRLALDIRRSKKRRTTREQRHAITRAAGSVNGDGTVSRHDLAIANGLQLEELRDILRNELDRLPAKYRMPLILYYFGGLSPDQIGKELKCKTSTLGVRLHRGRKMLADNLSSRGININSAIVGSMLLFLVNSSVRDNLVHACTHAAVHVAANGLVADATVSAPVVAMIHGVTRAIRLNRLKGFIAAVVLACISFTGSAEALKQLRSIDPSTLQYLNPLRLIRPLLERLWQPPRLTASAPATPPPEAIVFPTESTGLTYSTLSWPVGSHSNWISPPQFITGDVAHVESQRILASRFESFNYAPPLTLRTEPIAPAPEILAMPIPRFEAISQASSPATFSAPAVVPTQGTATPLQVAADAPIFNHDVLVIDHAANPAANSSDPSLFLFTGGTMHARKLVIGDATEGTLIQTGGHIEVDESVVVGNQPGSSGTVQFSGESTIKAPAIVVGSSGNGTFVQSGGSVVATTPDGHGQIVIGDKPGSTGNYTIGSGSVTADQIVVGEQGSGSLNQFGGDVYVNAAKIGNSAGGEGTWSVTGGTIQVGIPLAGIPVAGGAVSTSVQTGNNSPIVLVGGNGSGTVLLRSDGNGAAIEERAGGPSVTLFVRTSENGTGVIRGWGKVELTGAFIANGKVIADGFGADHALDFSTIGVIVNPSDNPADGGRSGWYARNGGSIKLPPVKVDGPGQYTWGEFMFDREIDLVNSVRFRLPDAAAGQVDITLLDPLTEQVPLLPTGLHGLSLWKLDSTVDISSIDLQVRYDDYLVSIWQKPESDLVMWAFEDGQWKALTDYTSGIDTAKHLIWATAFDPAYFAVGLSPDNVAVIPAFSTSVANTPEPATITGIGIVAALGLLSRRRR